MGDLTINMGDHVTLCAIGTNIEGDDNLRKYAWNASWQ